MEGIESRTHPEDIETSIEKMWEDTELTTIAFRRHGQWGHGADEVPAGALTAQGIKSSKEQAAILQKRIPEEAQVQFYESPSHIPAIMKTSEGIPKDISPQRARITASIYEQAISGRLAPAMVEDGKILRDYTGNPVSSVRHESASLGDLFEATDEERAALIPDFFALKEKLYPENDTKFWDDFVQNRLPEELQISLEKAGGSNALDLASNVSYFINQIATQDTRLEKNVALAITHGETMDSFLQQIRDFLQTQEENEAEQVVSDLDFDEGFTVHAGQEKFWLEIENKRIPIDWSAFQIFLQNHE
jgi:hypothetical protein